MKFLAHQVDKPWGRTQIPAVFGDTNGRRVGEIWFDPPTPVDLPLLIKYIFTSEKLSVQVHPNDAQARERGHRRGKSECWYVLEAEAGSRLGLGLRESLSPAELREAAIDASIERLLDWKPVTAGDFFLVPPGTIHAIGAGIALLEFQQNADLTFRLYDYGRPRELHLDDAVAVSSAKAYDGCWLASSELPTDTILLSGPEFSLVRATSTEMVPAGVAHRRRWVAPLAGSASSANERATAGECLLVEADAPLSIDASSVVLIGVEGALN